MTSHSLASVLLGVLGIYVVGETIIEMGTAVFFATIDSSDEFIAEFNGLQVLMSLAWVFLKLGLGVGLLAFRDQLARLVAKPEDGVAGTPKADVTSLQSALFGVVGAYFVIKGAALLARGYAEIPVGSGLSHLWPHYASSAAEVLFGLCLFFGARGLAGAWSSARSAGHDRSSRTAA